MKKHLSLFIALTLLFVGTSNAQSHEKIDITVNKFQTLYNNNKVEDIFGMFSPRIQSLMPLDKTKDVMEQLHKQAGNLESYNYLKEEQGISYYKTSFANTKLTLVITQDNDGKIETFRFIPFKEEGATSTEKSNIFYKSPTGKVYGTLEMPEVQKPVPVVLIIAGSGPTDRNGNQEAVKSNTYKMIADSLLKAGIASVRYDKRGVGESAGALQDESKFLFDDIVSDAAGFVKILKKDDRFSSVIVLGHSEGSLVGMIAAEKEKADGYISVAGLGDRADKIIVRQIAAQSEELSLKAAFIMDSLSKGHEVKRIDPALDGLFRPSVQPYIKSWIKYNPSDVITKLAIPVLILQGTTDLQVPVTEANKLKEAYPAATLTIIEGMNHVLKPAPENREKNMATYSDEKLQLSRGLVPAITKFVSGIKK